MLRRRILASAMASVMAIGSVAVVASAEDAAVATAQVKTKADLEAYVKSFDKFREDGIYDYGSISGEHFLNAIEYADNVLADDKAGVDEYTVAYAMIEAVYNKLTIYSAEELSTLIKSCTSIYDQNNVYSEELDDAVYSTGSWDDFEAAYDNAVSVQASSDSRIITDAYEKLDNAKKNLSPLTVVTKSQFRTVLKEYETILQKEFAYDSWRVGTISGWATIRTLLNDGNGNKKLGDWGFYNQSVSYGTLYEWAKYFNDTINRAYDALDVVKSVNKTSDEAIVTGFTIAQDIVDVYNAFTPDDTNRATKANVTKLLDQYHGRLVHDYATTRAQNLYSLVVRKVGAENLHNRLGDNYSSSINTNVPATTTAANAWYVQQAVFNADEDQWKDVQAKLAVKTDVTFYLVKNADGDVVDVTKTKPGTNVDFSTVRAKSEVDLTDYIIIRAEDIKNEWSDVDNHNYNTINDGDAYGAGHNTWSGFQNWDTAYSYSLNIPCFGGTYNNSTGESVNSYTVLDQAIELALTYIGGDKEAIKASDIYDIDTIGAIADGTAAGSSNEWTLVYRYLKYALSDKYDVTFGTHTRADVEKLIEDSYELAELTGDAGLFNVNHENLVKARQDALTWVKASKTDSKYADNTITYNIANGNGKITGSLVADQVYNKLEDYYNELMDDYKAFSYSFGEIYNKISDVKDAIDSDDLVATDALVASLEKTAYYLSVVSPIITDADGHTIDIKNDAFTSDRTFNAFNRVYTWTDADKAYELSTDDGVVKIPAYRANGEVSSHADLKEAYEALLAEVKAQEEPAVVVGDFNGDGVADQRDAAIILKKVVDGETIDIAIGDFDGDGYADQRDASAILKYVVNQA